MDALLETIDLDIEESQELLFKVRIEGTEPTPAKVRLVCEAGDMAYVFNGHPLGTDDIVQFVLPVLKDKLKEGVYLSRVEVLVDNRYFAPVTFNINMKKAIKVVAEAVQLPQRKATVPQVTVTATPVVVKKAPVPVVKATTSTLQERYKHKLTQKTTEDIDYADDDKLNELAQLFVSTKRKK